jgi:hypothetical protein
MPNRDGTGPMGRGRGTGGGWGPCATDTAGREGSRGGAGQGGRGRRNRFHATGLTGWQAAAQAGVTAVAVPTDRLELIEQQLALMLERLDGIETRDSK